MTLETTAPPVEATPVDTVPTAPNPVDTSANTPLPQTQAESSATEDETPENGPYVNPDRVADLKQNVLLANQSLADTVMSLRAYKMNGGNVVELVQENPQLGDAASVLNDRLEQESQNQKNFFSELAVATEPISHNTLLERMRKFESDFKVGADTLLTGPQRDGLRPEVRAELTKAEEILFKEHIIQAQDKKLSFIQQVLSNPDATDELKKVASEEARAAIVDQAKALQGIAQIEGSAETDFTALTTKAQELGISDLDLAAETTQVIDDLEVDTQVVEKAQENGVDYIQMLGLKDKDGNLLKGKATIFGAIAILFVLSDQLIAQAAGRQALLPMLVDVVGQFGNEMRTTKHMAHLKQTDPASYEYYKQMGYGENYLLGWIVDYFKKKAA